MGNILRYPKIIVFTVWQSDESLEFEILRGNLGYTQVELYKYVENEPVKAKTLYWDGIKTDGRNSVTFQVSPDTFFTSTP